MVNIRTLFVLTLMACSTSSVASDNQSVNATAVYGYDTNPHQLSNALQPAGQQFLASELKLRTNFFKWVYVSAKADKSIYFDDARADEYNLAANLSIRSKFKIARQKFRFKLGGNYRSKDKTFVSKTTGLVATFRGQSIADRYDSSQINYIGKLSYHPSRRFNTRISFQGRNKSYQSFDISGLSNLDYDHQRYLLGFEYKPSAVGRYFLDGAFTQRQFNDRRAKDLNGVNVLDTDLAYDYYTGNIGYIYRPNKKTRWKYTYNFESRKDNSSGYYDATSSYLSISARYQLGDYHFFKGRLKYSKFSFANQLDQGATPFDEESKQKQGGSALLGYEWVLATLFKTNLAFYLELEYANFANTNSDYTYEKGQGGVGFRWSAF